jgi:anaerobic selenocysteine-containing dehydrogenase
VLVDIEDGRAKRLRGNPAHPVTQGFLCAKVTRYLDREYHPDRILYPLRRTGAKGAGKFTRISWDEALGEIADRFKEIAATYGAEAILPYSYAGTMGLLNGSGMDRRFFHRLGASRLERTICSSAGSAGLMAAYNARTGIEPEALQQAKLILVWGSNTHGCNVHAWPFMVEARRKGARLYVIDPLRTRTAGLADRHYTPYPGSDMALALGLLHVIFAEGLEDREYIAAATSGIESLRERVRDYPPERAAALTGITADEIVALAREYATTRPAAIRLGYGVQRSERGGRAVQAITLLPAVTGAWREHGGGLLLSTSGGFQLNREAAGMPQLGPAARSVNMVQLGRALTELDGPPVQALFVYNSNPAAIAPEQNKVRAGLRREDLFTVVAEHLPTDTAAFADIVLPATTWLEHTDLYLAYGHYFLQLARPALAAPGETKPNQEIFRLLAARMGFDEPCFRDTDDDMIRQMLASGHPWVEGITLERLEREGFVRLNLPSPFLPHAAGRCNLAAEDLEYRPPEESRLGSAAYPLELVSAKDDANLNSTFGYRAEVAAAAGWLWIHPRDAQPRAIAAEDAVEIFNGRGRLRLKARITDAVRPGVVRVPTVGWGENPNVLIPDRLTDIGGGPILYNCLVEVKKCEN